MAPSHSLQRAPSPLAWSLEQANRQGVYLGVGGGGRHRGVSALGEPGLSFDYLRSALAVETCAPILGNKSFSELEKQAHLFPVTHRHTCMDPHTHQHTHTHTHPVCPCPFLHLPENRFTRRDPQFVGRLYLMWPRASVSITG